MMKAIEGMHTFGRNEAKREIRRLGVSTREMFAAVPPGFDVTATLQPIFDRLGQQLITTGVRLDTATVNDFLVRGTVDVGGIISAAGVRGAITGLLPQAFTSGLATTYEQAPDDTFGGYEYSAELDGGTCPECDGQNGTVFATLDEAYQVLPDFGPNPNCYGGWRCRCRLVPVAA